jgi:hypothetical protein
VDVERTIDFILKSQANAERRMDRIDTRLDGVSKLLQQGMRMLAKTDTTLHGLAQAQKRTDVRVAEAQKRTDIMLAGLAAAQKRTDTALAELAAAQKKTEQTLKTFIKSLGNGRNGRTAR